MSTTKPRSKCRFKRHLTPRISRQAKWRQFCACKIDDALIGRLHAFVKRHPSCQLSPSHIICEGPKILQNARAKATEMMYRTNPERSSLRPDWFGKKETNMNEKTLLVRSALTEAKPTIAAAMIPPVTPAIVIATNVMNNAGIRQRNTSDQRGIDI
jgi:hypothetical protein